MVFSALLFLVGLVLAMGAVNMKREARKSGTTNKDAKTLMIVGVVLIIVAVITRMK